MRIGRIPCVVFVSVALAQEHSPDGEKNPFAGNAAAAAAGARVYERVCQACHGGAGRGDRGPALTSGKLTHGNTDGEIFLSIRNGIKGTQMPGFAQLPTEQLWQLVTYIASLRGTNHGQETVEGAPGVGAALFFGKAECSRCHEVNARGGHAGPDLSSAGRFSAAQLRRKITAPGNTMSSGSRGRRTAGVAAVKLKDGRSVRGLRRAEDSFWLHLVDSSGRSYRFNKRDIADLRYEFGSLMPGDYSTRLNAAELRDLVAYLKTLSERDFSQTVKADLSGGLTYERLRNAQAEPQNWLTYWGDYQGRHFSALRQIAPSNVGRLQARWAAQMPGDSILEATPLVVDGVMYMAGSPGEIFALDALTGTQLWKFQRRQRTVNPYESNRYNRGVAVLGNRVFFGTLDAVLIALDARTGRQLWETQVADTMQGYSVTMAPLALKDKLIVGVAGGEYGANGYLDAYDPATGKRLWRFDTVPGPGQFGHDTWAGDSWKQGGGPTWLTGSYDPELDLLYWATGNPGPDIDAEVRKGDNLFTCSVVALDPSTGQRKWHYQFTPNDSHDWDANQDLILVDRVFDGQPRKLLLQANRNGLYYVLDRTNGKFLAARAFVKQTWNAGFDKTGRPILAPNSESTLEGNIVYPSAGGGTNWQSPSYDPNRGWVFLSTTESGQRYVRTPTPFEIGKQYWSGRGLGLDEAPIAAIKALDASTGQERWRFRIAQGSLAAGVLATGGGVVFAATREGNLIALDSATGSPLWSFQTGATIASSPMSYAVDGKQFVAVGSGSVLYSFALPE